MKMTDKSWRTFFAAALVFASSAVVSVAQTPPGKPVSVVVTLEPKHGKTIPDVTAQDITVAQGRDKRPVASLTPLPLNQGTTQMLLLLDDSARGTFDTEINTLKQFVQSLPPNVDIGIAYMRNGIADFTSKFTKDHAAAAKTIRVAFGVAGADVSPYDSITDAVKKWPASNAQRKVIVMVSSGIESLGGGYAPDNPYVNAGIRSAQKAGVVVYSIYSPSVGHFGHSLWRSTWGQNFLSQLADETGGEMYAIGFGSPVSFQPFLQQIVAQFQHQYLLTFESKPANKSGLQPVRISVTEKDASIAAPDQVYVPAST
jgi:VWFA-related protein